MYMYHRQQNKCYPEKCEIVRKTAVNCKHAVMKFDRSNKFDLCYYGQVNSLWLKSSVAWKWAKNTCGGNIYFAGDGTYSIYELKIKILYFLKSIWP